MIVHLANNPEFIQDCLEITADQTQPSTLFHHGDLEVWMRSAVPLKGDDYLRALSVVVTRGKEIKEHEHAEFVALYYVQPEGVPLITRKEVILPEPGDLFLLHPYTKHFVPPPAVEVRRVSIAMMIHND